MNSSTVMHRPLPYISPEAIGETPAGKKKCTKCRVEKFTPKDFYSYPQAADGYSYWCRECQSAAKRDRRAGIIGPTAKVNRIVRSGHRLTKPEPIILVTMRNGDRAAHAARCEGCGSVFNGVRADEKARRCCR